MANGLEVRVPFCDHRLIQYVFNVPWAMKSFDDREKGLLRAAVADLLPHSVLWRRKAHYPAPQAPGYGRLLCRQLGEVLAGTDLPVAPLLDLPAARRAAAEPEVAAAEAGRRDALENVLTLNCWLGEYPVELDLDV
ncbi:MAG: asparagine synthase-related protein [Pseudonocardiaceae bacterium]